MTTKASSPVLPRKDAETFSLMSGASAIRISGETTGGAFGLVEQLLPQGMATPLHVHPNDDETFYVLEGELTVYLDGVLADASAGDVIFLPRGVPHAYRMRSERVHVLSLCTPAGHERFFRLVGRPVPSLSIQPDVAELPDMQQLATAAAEARFEVLGPPPFDEQLDD